MCLEGEIKKIHVSSVEHDFEPFPQQFLIVYQFLFVSTLAMLIKVLPIVEEKSIRKRISFGGDDPSMYQTWVRHGESFKKVLEISLFSLAKQMVA